jgi:hypothetical protein
MTSVSATDKRAIWNALDELARRHRAYADAAWALSDEELQRIESVAALLRPADPIENNQYLFDSSMPELGVKKLGQFPEYQHQLKEARERALREIHHAHGMAGIRRLVAAANEAFAIGWALAEADMAVDEEDTLADLDNDDFHRAAFSIGFARGISASKGWEWISATAHKLHGRPVAQARTLLCADDKPAAWELASTLGPDIEGVYWREFLPYGLGPEFELASETAAQLLAHRRNRAAIDLLALYVDKQKPRLDPKVVATSLERLAAEGDPEGQPSSYELQRLLEYLATTDIDEDRLALLEWLVRPGLGFGARSPVLERKLARDPGFFIQILAMCFRRRDHAEESVKISKEQAQNAYRLLDEWRVVPGSREPHGEVDAEWLAAWIEEARRRAVEADRSIIADLYIGHIFAHAREDVDGTWPTLAVREQIEKLASDKVDEGFRVETYNKRGVTSRGLTDGGKQEYELASKFEALASKISNGWPRTAAVLRSIAEGYKAQGRAEDEEAKRFQEGLEH